MQARCHLVLSWCQRASHFFSSCTSTYARTHVDNAWLPHDRLYVRAYRPTRVATLFLWASCADRPRNKFKNLTIKEKEAVKTATAHELMSIKLAAPSSGPGTPVVGRVGSSHSLNREV